jgi:hypothetical protein
MIRLHSQRSRTLVLGAALLSLSVICPAQETRGSITGKITDPQSAVIPGAPVTVTNTLTGVVNKITTNQTGYYEVNFLDPGTYSVSGDAAGFKTTLRTGIVLNTGDRLTVDLQLEVGAATQSVEVTGQAPLLDTTGAAGGRLMDTRDTSMLPYTTMNPFSFAAVAPGMVFTGSLGIARVFDNAGTASYNTFGGIGVGNEFLLDGAPVSGMSGAVGFAPSSEAVGEVRIETSPFDASMGHTSGAYVSATTKSGTNMYHGSGFDQVQNYRWNATPFFTRLAYQAGINNGTIAPGTPQQSSGKLSQPGFSIGGPVRIPKIYNGKNKLFFFFEYNKITNIEADPNTPIFTMPTAAERTGDFSALLPVNAIAYTVYDPRTATTVNGHVTRTPFPNNIVPSSLITDPIYKLFSQVYPLPNNVPGYVQPDGTNNYYDPSEPYNDYFNSIVNRFDYNISDKQRISGKWYWNHRLQNANDWGHTTPLAGYESNGLLRLNKGGSGDYLYTFNSNNVLDVGLGLQRYGGGDEKPIMNKYNAAAVGLPSYIDTIAGGYDYMPALTVNGVATTSGGPVPVPGEYPIPTTGSLTAKMMTVHGRHTLKYGADERRYWYATAQPGGNPTGSYSFDQTYVRQADNTTTASNLGLGWAAFELGIPTNATITRNDTGFYSTRYHAGYIQDDFRVTSRLRLGFGLRFEREGGISERFNRGIAGGYNFGFVPAYAQAAQAAYAASPIAQLPASQFVVSGGVNYLGTTYPNWTNGTNRLLPNVSAVYAFNNKTVVRIGYGWFADTFNAINSRSGQNGYSQTTSTAISTDNGLTFCCGVGAAANLSTVNPMMNPFPVLSTGQRVVLPFGNSLGSDVLDGQSDTYYPRDYAPALQQRWKLSFQREITRDMVIDVSYNGSWASVPFTKNLSYLPAQYWNFADARSSTTDAAMTAAVPNPFNAALLSMQTSNPTLYNYLSTVSWFSSKTLQVQQLLRAYPNAGSGLSEADGFTAKSVYNDVELLFRKRFALGFQSSVAYTHQAARQQWQPNQFDPALSWELSPNARPNRLVWTTVWELPFGRGRQWLTHGPLQHIVGGWQLSWITQYQTGSLISWGNLYYYGSLDQVVAALNHPQQENQSHNVEQWFNPAAAYNNVTNPADAATGAIPSGFVGFEGRTAFQPNTYQARIFPQYVDSLRADGIRNWDTKIYRRFVLYERLNMNLALDMMNMTNHIQFGGPNTTVTATNFGYVTGQSNSPRALQLNVRFEF